MTALQDTPFLMLVQGRGEALLAASDSHSGCRLASEDLLMPRPRGRLIGRVDAERTWRQQFTS